ncbi:MAG: hypothetical protein J2O49_04920 [Sciscionella sp.]|nr:hypothetical protein [Sciscionella sp.]
MARPVPAPRQHLDPLERIVYAALGSGDHRVIELPDLLAAQRFSPADGFGPIDAVRAHDDLFLRLAHDKALQPALSAAARALRPGGVLVAAVPEMDRLRRLRPTAPPPKVTVNGGRLEVTVQLWDWASDGDSYGLEIVRMFREHGRWEVASTVSTQHRVLTGDELADRLRRAGFVQVNRLSPEQAGHPLPVWIALAP